MYYLGIDPWVRKLWYALIDNDLSIVDAWIILINEKSPTRETNFDRMKQIDVFFDELLAKYKIKAVWIEKLYFTDFNQANAEFVYWIRWALLIKLIKKNITIHEYTPKQLKKSITWNGNAQKILVQRFVSKIFNLEKIPDFDDAADALWLAYLAKRND